MGVDTVVMVTGRTPNDSLATDLLEAAASWDDVGLRSVQAIGDAWVPSTIASAVWWGHRYAEELETDPEHVFFRREYVSG